MSESRRFFQNKPKIQINGQNCRTKNDTMKIMYIFGWPAISTRENLWKWWRRYVRRLNFWNGSHFCPPISILLIGIYLNYIENNKIIHKHSFHAILWLKAFVTFYFHLRFIHYMHAGLICHSSYGKFLRFVVYLACLEMLNTNTQTQTYTQYDNEQRSHKKADRFDKPHWTFQSFFRCMMMVRKNVAEICHIQKQSVLVADTQFQQK